MVLQMVSPDKKKKNREKRKKKSNKYRAELEKTKEGRAILNKTKLYMSIQKEKKVATDKKTTPKKKSGQKAAAAKKRLLQRKKKNIIRKNKKVESAKKFDNYQKTYPPYGVFNDGGGLISGKSLSLANRQKFSTSPKSGRIKLTGDRVPRKCSEIHPHCSICGKCHRNVRTHWIGH